MEMAGEGDPTAYSCFQMTRVAEEAVVDFVLSKKFNGYASTVGLPQTRRAIAEYLSRDLPYELSSDDVFVTSSCTQAIDDAILMLLRPGANILLPRPGFPLYEVSAAFRNIEREMAGEGVAAEMAGKGVAAEWGVVRQERERGRLLMWQKLLT